MNTRRFLFWASFVVILGLIVWGLVVALNKPRPDPTKPNLGSPAPVAVDDHVRGPVGTPVTLIEYSDFECPACKAYHPFVERLMTEASTTLRFVYRHFPLYPLPHKNAVNAAVAAEAAHVQGRFWDMYNVLFDTQEDWDGIADPTQTFVGYAEDLGLNVVQFRNDLGSSTLRDKVIRQKDEGVQIGINSTPTFFINGVAITNPNNYAEFKALIDAAAQASAN